MDVYINGYDMDFEFELPYGQHIFFFTDNTKIDTVDTDNYTLTQNVDHFYGRFLCEGTTCS